MSSPQTPSPLHAFDALRRPYAGPTESVRCIEVDSQAQRLYVASCANAVLVWHLTSRKPLAALKHPFWVNAVRRYPPLFPPWQPVPSSSPSPVLSASPQPTAPSDYVVLTACEDGVVTAWHPDTYSIVDQVRPGFGAITALHTISSCVSAASSPSSSSSTGKDTLCFAASLDHVFVLQVQPQLRVLQDLVHPGTCLTIHVAVEPFTGPQASRTAAGGGVEQHSPLLVVGQEDGSIVCWSCPRGTLQWEPLFGATRGPADRTHDPVAYKDTLLYPAGELDVERDARESRFVRRPGVNIATNQLKNTFRYNSRRVHPDGTDPLPDVDEETFLRTMPLQSPAAKRASRLEAGMQQTDRITYDRRRVTCLAGAPAAGGGVAATRFVSGHATGEVLLWDSIVGPKPYRRSVTVLLKKLPLFDGGAWVWSMVAMPLPLDWHDAHPTADRAGHKLPLPSLVKKDELSSITASVTQPSDTVFAICSDNGSLIYITGDETVQLSSGPGFTFTAGGYWCSQPREPSRWPSVHAVFGAFDGRIEAFDVTAVAQRLRSGEAS